MRIGVVSDTHSGELPSQLIEEFKNVDLIIHAGDFCSLQDYKTLSKLKNITAVYGNMDDSDIRAKFPRKQILSLEGFEIGLFHGEGPPQKLFDVVKSEFKNEKVDIVIFGHSHNPINRQEGKVLYFNPGSPNDTVYAPYCSYGIISLKHNQIHAKIVKVK